MLRPGKIKSFKRVKAHYSSQPSPILDSILSCCRRPSATLRQRLLGKETSSSLGLASKQQRPGDRGEVAELWHQLRQDIETAMAKKPTPGHYKRFSVITREVGVGMIELNIWLLAVRNGSFHPV